MANANKPRGFELIGTEGKEVRVRKYTKATGTALYPGDVVKASSSGEVVIGTASAATLLGVCAAYAASADTEVLVIDDEQAVFEAMALGDFQQTDIFQNADVNIASADTDLKRSQHSIDMSTKNTTAGLQVKLLGLIDRGENAFGSYARVRCKINNHAFKAGVAGV